MQIDLWMNSWTRGWADMNTMINVIRAVSGLVEQVFGAPPTTKDITEGFNRPCTYVQPTLMQTSLEGGLRHDSYSVEIIRFGPRTRDGWLGLLEAQASLAETLENPIPIGSTFFLYPEEVDFDLRRNEMTLITSFDVDIFQIRPETDVTKEFMEELTIRKD